MGTSLGLGSQRNMIIAAIVAVSTALSLVSTARADPDVPITPNDQQLLRGMAQMGVQRRPLPT